MYRVTHLVADLGWIELDMSVPLTCLPALSAKFQLIIQVNPTQVPDQGPDSIEKIIQQEIHRVFQRDTNLILRHVSTTKFL